MLSLLDYLVKEGDTGDQIFIVLDGIIELTRTTDKGEFVIEKLNTVCSVF